MDVLETTCKLIVFSFLHFFLTFMSGIKNMNLIKTFQVRGIHVY